MKSTLNTFRSRSQIMIGLLVIFTLSVSCSLFENEQSLHLCEEVYIVAEQMPILIGGMADLQGRVQYPKEAKKHGVEGRVTVQFVVDKLGNVRDAEVTRGIGAGADEEALRVVKSAKFEPGEQEGKTVCVQYALSINFRIDN